MPGGDFAACWGTTMTNDRLEQRLIADAQRWRAARSDDVDLHAVIARLDRPRAGRALRLPPRTALIVSVAAVFAVALGIGVFAVVRPSALRPGIGPANLPTCGDAPATSGQYPAGVTLRLIAPRTAVSGTTIHPVLELLSQNGRSRVIPDAGSDPEPSILYRGHVVGQYNGAIGGTGLGVRLGAKPVRLPTSPLLLSGCPAGATNPAHPDANRTPLPPGRYQLVASLQSDTSGSGKWTMTTPPVPLRVIRPPVGPLVTTRMGQLLIQHPARWHYIPVAQAPMGMGSPLGWLSNQPPRRQCVTSGNRTVCGPPIRSLLPGGIYIDAGDIVHFAPPGIALHPNMRVDGHDAQLTTSPPRWLAACPTGTTDRLTLLIDASSRPNAKPDGIIYVTACSAQPSAATTAAIRHMLGTVRLPGTR